MKQELRIWKFSTKAAARKRGQIATRREPNEIIGTGGKTTGTRATSRLKVTFFLSFFFSSSSSFPRPRPRGQSFG